MKRIIKNYDQLPPAMVAKIKTQYPEGYADHLIRFNNSTGAVVSALPFQFDDIIYMIRMTVAEAIELVEFDDEFLPEHDLDLDLDAEE
ncbi:MAG: hypothetical protein ACR2MX_05975 [Cyclobacteriaceae bacterium]